MAKAVLVTGASSGIGAACARLAARDGWDVGIHYNSDDAGARAVLADVQAAGRKGVLLQGDVADSEGVAAIYAGFDAAFLRMDALINNAGMISGKARIEEMSEARLTRIFAVNVVGAFLVAGQAVRRMSTAHGGEGGAIVNMSSVAARLGAGGQYADYAATKGAIDTFTRGLADEVAAEGIRVVALRPGLIETPIHGKAGDPDRPAKLAPGVPMRRTGSADEVAEAAVWLISDAASYVTATWLDVSGGR